MCWIKRDSGSGLRYIFCRGTADGTESLRVGANDSGVYFDYGDGGAYTQSNQGTPSAIWIQLVCVVKAGEKGRIYINGVEQTYSNQNAAPSPFLNAVSYYTLIGRHYDNNENYVFSGDIALLRVGGTIPSAEQIAKIYNDEKRLFADNAQATLYGASDAVTALGYDDTTELLHIGTSAGRSVFQGINRVENTTDAIGGSISASNGLVAEE